jgi:Glycosyl hydrolases family 38 N-terminal domain
VPFHLAIAESTDLFVGSEESPRQVLRVRLSRTLAEPVPLVVRGEGVRGQARIPAGVGVATVEVGLALPDRPPGSRIPVTVEAGEEGLDADVTVERPGYHVHLVSHVRADALARSGPDGSFAPVADWAGDGSDDAADPPGFALLAAHVELAMNDPDYRFVLVGVEALKPYLDTFPGRRADLRGLIDDGRVELAGGAVPAAAGGHSGAETAIRGVVDLLRYQRDVLGGDPATAWHPELLELDPQLPGHLAAAGLTSSALVREPFRLGSDRGGDLVPGLSDAGAGHPSEFEWISPCGQGVLAHAMPGDHAATWWLHSATTLDDAEQAVYAMYRLLRPAGATRHLLVPVGAGDTLPNRWVPAVHRSWNAKYVWPRFTCSTPRAFLAGVRGELAADGRRPSPQTRVPHEARRTPAASTADTARQALRAAEVAVGDAEKLATVAALYRLDTYPDTTLTRAWRLLAHGARVGSGGGTDGDVEHLDRLAGLREAYDVGVDVRDTALGALVARVDTSGDGAALVVANTLPFDRSDLVRVPGCPSGWVLDDRGNTVPAARDRGTLFFRADDVPALGWRTYRLSTGRPTPRVWSDAPGTRITNESYAVTADPHRGGGLTSIVDLRTRRALLADGAVANELVLRGTGRADESVGTVGSAITAAVTRRETGPLGERLVSTGEVDGLGYEQTVTLWFGVDRIDFRTRVHDWSGTDSVLDVRFPIDLPGALPIAGTSAAVVAGADDGGAAVWFGLGATARLSVVDPSGRRMGERALGTAEVVVGQPDAAASTRDLVVALARVGVLATTASAHAASRARGESWAPDFRIVLGGPDENPLTRELLARAEPAYVAEYERQLAASGQVLLWLPADRRRARAGRPGADRRDAPARPALLVVGPVDELVADVGDSVVEAVGLEPPAEPLSRGTVALLSYGLPMYAAEGTGALRLCLLGSRGDAAAAGAGFDGADLDGRGLDGRGLDGRGLDGRGLDETASDVRTWTHDFAYALVSGPDDWRALTMPARAQEYSTPLLSVLLPRGSTGPGPLPRTHSVLGVGPARKVLLTALKPAGDAADPDTVTLRLVESTGLGGRARLAGEVRLTDVRRADLLEYPGEPVSSSVDLVGFEVATLVARQDAGLHGAVGDTEQAELGAGALAVGRTASARDVPAYARHWLHHDGPAPSGGLPVTVTVSPTVVRADGAAPVYLDVVVSSQLRQVEPAGVATLRVPSGWQVEPHRVAYALGPAGDARFTARVRPGPDAAAGLSFVSVRIEHAGSVVEDVATVAVGPFPAGPANPYHGTGLAGTGLLVDVVKPEVVVRPGGRSAVGVLLTNQTRDEIRGELRLVSPWEAWSALPLRARDFAVSAGSEVEAEFPVLVPADCEPGRAWTVVKVAWFGRRQYAPVVRLVVAE